MRLPLTSLRLARPTRPLPAVALLLALLVPAGTTAAPAAPEDARPAVSSALTAGAPADADAAPYPSTPSSSDAASGAAADSGAPTLRVPEGGLALTPFLDYLSDPTGTLTIGPISAPERDADFRPFEARNPPRQAGTLWLRLRLAPVTGAMPASADGQQARLDLGDQIPGEAEVWTRTGAHPPVPTEAEGGLFPLPGLSAGGEVFIRLDGLPGLWFAPALRTVSDSLSTPDRRVHPLLLAALTALLLLCLVRSVTERGDGRLWAGLLTGAALLHAVWGVPATPRGTVVPLDMPGLLAAGVALLLLPHVGRNIMRTRDTSPGLDVLLLVLALPGAALVVLPLLPGLAWTARLFSLWPLGAAFALVPALLLLTRGVPGSGLFVLACLGLVAGGGLGLWGVNGNLNAPLWGQAPLAGITFAALLLAAAAPRSAYAVRDGAADTPPPPGGMPDLDPPDRLSGLPRDRALRLEEILRAPLDALLREACSLDQILDRPADQTPLSGQDARQVRRHADNLVAATRELSALITDLPRLGHKTGQIDAARQVFDLTKLVQSVFADVGDALQNADLGLSWYIAPHLGRLFKGDRDRLRFVLALLLADAARASERGAVSLRVRRADMSPNPGHLQFTVADTGAGTPPLRRSSLALAKAWELASDHRGDLFVDSTPHGVEITFSLDCVALADDGVTPRPVPPTEIGGRRDTAEPDPRLVIVAAASPLNRQMLAFYLEDQGQTIWEARDAEEAVALYTHTPAALVVFDGHLPEDDIVSAVAAIRVFEGERILPATPFLALTLDEEQAERLHQAGCDHSLPLPVVRGEFRAMSLHLASPSGIKPRPSIVPHRVPPSRPRRVDVPAPRASASETEASAFSPLGLRPTAAPVVSPPVASPPAGPIPASPSSVAPPAPLPSPVPSTPQAPSFPTVHTTEGVTADALHDTPPSRLAAVTQRDAPRQASSGLNLPPAPKKRLNWLHSLFKPTPRIMPTLPDEKVSSSSEWVGDPVPVPSAAPSPSARPATPLPHDVTPPAAFAGPDVTPVTDSADERSPSWYSPYDDDPECSVGEPVPVPAPSVPSDSSVPVSDAPEVTEIPSSGQSSAHDADAEGAAPRGTVPDDILENAPGMAATATLSGTPTTADASGDDDESDERPIPHLLAEEPATVSPIETAVPASGTDADIPAPSAPTPERPTFPPDTALARLAESEKNTGHDAPAPCAAPRPVPALSVPPPTSRDEVPGPGLPADAREPGASTPEAAGPADISPPVPVDMAPRTSEPERTARRGRPETKPRRRKNRVETLPFLSLDPNYTPPPPVTASPSVESDRVLPRLGDGEPSPPPVMGPEDSDDIVELTEADMVASPLLQQVPDLLRSLDAAVEHAAGALERRDPWGLINASDRMADRATAFGLHALSDLALCLKEAGQKHDFDTATQLLPELRAEVERHRRG